MSATFLLFAAIASALASDCPSTDAHDRSLADVTAAMEAAEAMFTTNIERFARLMAPVRVTVGCLAAPMTPELAARYHRLYALQRDPSGRFGADSVAVAGSLRAARVLDPTFTFSDDLLPPGHPMRDAHDKMPPDPGPTERAKAPREGELWFDGSPSRERPVGAATVFQLVGPDLQARTTVYLPADAILPEYPLDPVLRRSLSRGAAAAALLAAAAWSGALATEARFDAGGASLPSAEAKKLRSTNNALFVAALSGGAVAVGLGAGAVAVGQR